VLSHLIQQISAVRLYIPQDLRPVDNRQSVGKSIQVNTKQKDVGGLWVVSVMSSCEQQRECWQVNSGKN
jgi:hypothetical protein